MKVVKFIVIASILLCTSRRSGMAQTSRDSIQYSIESTDGNVYFGTILSKDSVNVSLKTDNLGTIILNRKDIVSIKTITDLTSKDGVYWLDNPQATRYFISGNGYGLKKGETYYQNAWILFDQINVGVTDNFSIGAGLIPTFLFGSSEMPVWITPKVSVPIIKGKLNIGGGAFLGTVLGQDGVNYGILYGVSTFGSRDRNVSVGIGYGFSDGKLEKKPMISLSGIFRTGPKGYIITENYLLDTGNDFICFLSIGGRRIIKNIGLDYGLFIPTYQGLNEFIAIPWLGLIIPLSK